jgi:hypothetical protein
MIIETESTRYGPCRAHQRRVPTRLGTPNGAGRADLIAFETKSSQAVANVCCSLATVSKRLAIHSVQTIIASDGFLAVSSRFSKSASICRIHRISQTEECEIILSETVVGDPGGRSWAVDAVTAPYPSHRQALLARTSVSIVATASAISMLQEPGPQEVSVERRRLCLL